MANQISVRVFVDKEKNRVLYAEAGKDFVGVVLSFLTLPLGAIARLVSQDSNMKPCRFGSISSLYASVGNMDPKYFNSETCKEMLLHPRNSMHNSNHKLKLNIDDTEPTKFYACAKPQCRRVDRLQVSIFFNKARCSCGGYLTYRLDDEMISLDYIWNGYVREALYVVYDDLKVKPINLTTSSCLLTGLRTKGNIEDFTLNINLNEVMDLLKCSLVSNTVLTDSLLRTKNIVIENPEATMLKASEIGDIDDDRRTMKMNMMISKSKCKVLFALVDDDFMEQLLSFLTMPLGTVERVLRGNSGLGCIDNLYNSSTTFDSVDFMSGDNMFADLKVALQHDVKKQMLPIRGVMCPSPLCLCYSKKNPDNPSSRCYLTAGRYYRCKLRLEADLWDPKYPSTSTSSHGYVKRPMVFMIADDLSAKPFSSSAVLLSFLNESQVSEHDDFEERSIFIGVQEVVNILKASMISTSALTIGLGQLLWNTPIKEEK